MVIKSVGPLSVGTIYGAITAAFGLLAGIILGLAGVAGAGIGGDEGLGFMGPLLGLGAVITLPLLYGAMGFVFGVLGAALYNLFAGMVGGVEVRTE